MDNGSVNEASAVVIAHFHPEGRVAVNTVDLVKYLAPRTGQIVIVSTGINDSAIATVEPYARVIPRDNFGYDFWSYKVGIDALGDRDGLEKILLLNNSFIATDPEALMTCFLQPVKEPRIKGLTISTERIPHIQSYLFSMETRSLINSRAFNEWWGNMRPIDNRAEVISRYEIGMSRYFHQQGYKLTAEFEPSNEDLFLATGRRIANRGLTLTDRSKSIVSLNLNAARALNPTHYLWDVLYERFRILKVELLKKNPTEQYLAMIESLEPEIRDLISDALT